MRNAVGAVQSLVVLGGASDIGAAIAERLAAGGCRRIVLAGRRPDAMAPVADRLRAAGAEVAITAWDATDVAGHADAVKAAWAALPGDGGSDDVDCVLYAAGVLGDQEHLEDDPTAAAELTTANYTGAVSTLLHVGRRLEEQGHGAIVVLSSVAGERIRKSNFVYGASKAGLDAFAQGLGDALADSGITVTVVRPGFVRTAMTEGLDAPPLSTTPEDVAEAVVTGLAAGRHTIWVPSTFRYVMAGFRHLPRPVWRRLSSKM